MTSIVSVILAKLKREPVAVWGVVIAALIGVLAAAGVPSTVLDPVVAVVTLLGIPVVRGAVTPVAALKAVVSGTVAPVAPVQTGATPASVPPKADAGHSEVDTVLLVLAVAGVLLLLLGVTLR